MSETRRGGGPEQQLEHSTEELDHRLHELGDHISAAEEQAKARREEAIPGEDVAGDWEETRGTPGQGQDPAGAVDEGRPREG
jgi:hypothetical protein